MAIPKNEQEWSQESLEFSPDQAAQLRRNLNEPEENEVPRPE